MITTAMVNSTRQVLQRAQKFYWRLDDLADGGGCAVPAFPFPLQSPTNRTYYESQALGSVSTSNLSIPGTRDGTDLGDPYGVERLSVVDDPDNPGRRVFRIVLNKNDPDQGGTNKKRNEISLEAGSSLITQAGVRYVFGTEFKPGEDWTGTNDPDYVHDPLVNAGTGDYMVLFQLGFAGTRPTIEFVVFDTTFYVVTRYDPDGDLNSIDTIRASGTIRQGWNSIAGELTLDPVGTAGVFKFWFNGDLIVDFTGGIGYNVVGELGHFKFGVYKAMADFQIWDRVPTRSIYSRGFVAKKNPITSPQEMLNILSQF